MKKLIGIAAVAALLATSAFAEINIGAGFNQGTWTPFFLEKIGDEDVEIKMSVGAPWGGGVRTGVSFAGAGENIGFVLDIKGDGGEIGVNDNSYVWAKPWEWLEIRAGNWFGDSLRSTHDYGIRASRRIGLGAHDTTTFARISSDDTYDGTMNGALLAITPIEGLFIGAGFDIGNGHDWDYFSAYGKDIKDVFKDSQYVVGYTIDGLLAIKAQYMGGATAGIFKTEESKDDLKGTINAGVDLLMLEGMKICVGAFIPLEKDKNMSFAATFNGGFDALSINAYAGVEVAMGDGVYAATSTYSTDYKCGIEAGVGVGYDLGNGVGLSGDVRYRIDLPKDDAKAQNEVTVGLFASKGMSNGSLSIGVEGDFRFGAEKYIGVAVPLAIQCGF